MEALGKWLCTQCGDEAEVETDYGALCDLCHDVLLGDDSIMLGAFAELGRPREYDWVS